VVGLDLEHLDERRADHDLLELVRSLPDGDVTEAATHWASAEGPHVALSVALDGRSLEPLLQRLPELGERWCAVVAGEVHGDAALAGATDAARKAHVARTSGRVVLFPGSAALVGTLPVRDLLDRSAVDRVQVLTAAEAAPDAVVDTRGHVRPTWQRGQLVLLAQPAVGDRLVPYESPDPTPCCADH
jgi:hypothetical protein